MSLTAPMTLGEIRDEVLVRVGAASQGNLGTRWHAKVESFVRSSLRQLFVEASWTVLKKTTTAALVVDDRVVDWPDDSEPGSIISIVVVDDEDNQYQLAPGLRPNERESARTPSGRPMLYTYTDGDIEIYPAPTEKYVGLIIDYTMSETVPIEADDEVFLDPEAVIMLTAMAFKRDQGLPTTGDDRAEYERYLSRMRARQGDGEGFVVGGAKTDVPLRRNRVNRSKIRFGNGAPFTEDWNPY